MNPAGAEFESAVQRGIQRMTLSGGLTDFVDYMTVQALRLSHGVFMEHAVWQERDNLSNTSFIVQFRTWKAETSCIEHVVKTKWAHLKAVLEITLKNSETRGVAGNLFEAVAHQTIPTQFTAPLEELTLYERSKSKRKSASGLDSRFNSYYNSAIARRFKVDFEREEVVNFDFHAPKRIKENCYYRGCRTTPLIDAFLVQKTDGGRMILYFLQISTSEKKESTALIQGPPPRLEDS